MSFNSGTAASQVATSWQLGANSTSSLALTNMSTFRTGIDADVTSYLNNVTTNGIYNRSYAATKSLNHELTQKNAFLSSMRDKARTHVQIARFRAGGQRYTAGWYGFLTWFTQVTLFFMAVGVWIIVGRMRNTMAVQTSHTLVALLLTVYVLAIVFIIRYNITRRLDNWNKFYWRTAQNSATTCTSGGLFQ